MLKSVFRRISRVIAKSEIGIENLNAVSQSNASSFSAVIKR